MDRDASGEELRAWTVAQLRRGDVRSVVSKLEQLPFDVLLQNVDLALALGLAGGLVGDMTLVRSLLVELDDADRSGRLPAAARIALAHLRLSSCMWEGRLDDLVDAVAAMEMELASARDDGRSFIIDGSSAQVSLTLGLLLAGRLDEAVEAAELTLTAAELLPVSRPAVLAAGVKALALAWSGSASRACEAARQAEIVLDRYVGVGTNPMAAHIASCWAGPLDTAPDALDAAEALGRELPLPPYLAVLALCRVRLFVRCGDLGAAASALTAADAALDAVPQPGYLRVVADQLRLELDEQGASQANSLTPLEVRAVELLAGGASRSEIARELHYSVNTVKSHLRHAYHKLGASSRDEAIRNARLRGLIDQG